MDPIKRVELKADLTKYPVYKIDTELNSKHFRISEFPSMLASGKSHFLIRGTDDLKIGSHVEVEILDKNGNVVYTEISEALINGTDRIVSIYVYSDTVFGDGKLTVLGELIDVPKQWKGKYNVKWERSIFINPTVSNIDGVIFINEPRLY